MSAVLNRLAVLDTKPQRVEGFHTAELNDYDWKVRFGYRITKHGRPNSRSFGSNNPDADGIPHEVAIVKAWLLNKAESREVEIPVSMIPADLIADHETEIAQALDEEQT